MPAVGSGRHTYLNGGSGLVAVPPGDSGVTYEAGWQAWMNPYVTPTDANLSDGTCDPGHAFATWTPAPGAQERLPMNCVTTYEAAAFCIWDGGFLPSDSELEYAASGGSDEREYPWGSTGPGGATQYAIFACLYPTPTPTAPCVGVANIAPVGTATLGVGRWGQLDLAGSVIEMALDSAMWHTTTACADCVDQAGWLGGTGRAGGWDSASYELYPTSTNGNIFGSQRASNYGIRCARAP
jgi:formylglycine-generating enzyme required for sulfatase activity